MRKLQSRKRKIGRMPSSKVRRKCRGCGKTTVKLFTIADDLEHPKPYHKHCIDKLLMEVFLTPND